MMNLKTVAQLLAFALLCLWVDAVKSQGILCFVMINTLISCDNQFCA